jgi:Tfp pilus assembly protein PilZ
MLILKTRFRSKREFLEAYNEDLPHGGLFCPTTQGLEENEQVVVELHFPGLPNKMLMRGRVVWWRSALPRLRVRAGAMVTFLEEEKQKKDFILEVAEGDKIDAIKRRHPRIPVEMTVRWRSGDSPHYQESMLRDISIGGALLVTDDQLQTDAEIVLELTTPGGAGPIPIAGKVTYRTEEGVGIKFLYRDGGGSQRLREVIRRLINSED